MNDEFARPNKRTCLPVKRAILYKEEQNKKKDKAETLIIPYLGPAYNYFSRPLIIKLRLWMIPPLPIIAIDLFKLPPGYPGPTIYPHGNHPSLSPVDMF